MLLIFDGFQRINRDCTNMNVASNLTLTKFIEKFLPSYWQLLSSECPASIEIGTLKSNTQ